MALFGDKDDDRDGGKPKKKGSVFTQDLGPLPVWGWLTVAVAGIFLYRMMVKPKGEAAEGEGKPDPQQFFPYPTGGVGGVFLIPSGAGGAAPTTPPEGEPPVASVGGDFFKYLDKMRAGFGGASLEQLAGQSITDPAGSFNTYTATAKAAGYPYVQGDTVINPATGKTFPVASWHGMTVEQRLRLSTGDPAAWAAVAP